MHHATDVGYIRVRVLYSAQDALVIQSEEIDASNVEAASSNLAECSIKSLRSTYGCAPDC